MAKKRIQLWADPEVKKDIFEIRAVMPDKSQEDVIGEALREFREKRCGRKREIFPKW